MRKTLIFLLFCLGVLQLNAQIEEDNCVVTYIDSIGNTARRLESRVQIGTYQDEHLICSRNSMIIAKIAPNGYITEGMERCISTAMNIWEDKLGLKAPVTVIIECDELDPSVSVKTDVCYKLYNRMAIPETLYRQIVFNEPKDTLYSNVV